MVQGATGGGPVVVVLWSWLSFCCGCPSVMVVLPLLSSFRCCCCCPVVVIVPLFPPREQLLVAVARGAVTLMVVVVVVVVFVPVVLSFGLLVLIAPTVHPASSGSARSSGGGCWVLGCLPRCGPSLLPIVNICTKKKLLVKRKRN